jgi:hypothetical protein
MKRNSLTKGLVVSVALSAFLTGCGTIDDLKNDFIEEIKQAYIEGKAVDGYLQNATVCLDLNSDGICQETEPNTKTAKDGSYKLDISEDIEKNPDFYKAMVLVYGGTDKDTGVEFKGKLLASHDGKEVHVTPMTTLVAKAIQNELKSDQKLTQKELETIRSEHRQKVANLFGLSVDDIEKDPVAIKDTNPKLIQESLKLQKILEAINIDKDKDAIEDGYEKLAENLKDAGEEQDLNALLEKAYKDHTHLNDAQKIVENIDKSFEKFKDDLDLSKIGLITKEDLKELERGEHVKVGQENRYFNDDIDWDKELIKSELDDHGVTDVTDDQIEAIKDKLGDNIEPGIIEKDLEKLKDEDDELMKGIFDKFNDHDKDKKDHEDLAEETGSNVG